MELPLNEWDVALRSGSFLSCKSWHEFMALMNKLADEYDVQKVLFPQNEASILHKEIHELKSENLRLKIKIFYNFTLHGFWVYFFNINSTRRYDCGRNIFKIIKVKR